MIWYFVLYRASTYAFLSSSKSRSSSGSVRGSSGRMSGWTCAAIFASFSMLWDFGMYAMNVRRNAAKKRSVAW